MANYIGMNYNLDCVCYDAWDETTIMAFKADVIQFFTNEVLTSTQSRLAMFPEIGTNTISSVYRSSQAGTNPNTFWQLYFYDIAGNYWRYEASSLNPTGYTFLNSGSHPWLANVGPRGEGWQLWFKNNNGVMMVDLNGNTGQYVAYGSGTQYYPTLPNTQVPDACWHNTATGVVYVSIVDTIYLLDTATTTVTSFAKYNVAPVHIFDGVPWDHTASVGYDNDPTITYFFRMNPTTNLNQVFIHDETTNTTTISDIGIPTMFPDLPTNIPITHGSAIYPANPGEHKINWVDNTLSPPLQFIVTTSPTVTVNSGSQNLDYVYHTGTSVPNPSTSISWYAVLGYDFFLGQRGAGGISHYLTTGNYGGVGQPYAGLPYIAGGVGVETNYCSILRVTGQFNQVYLFTPTGDAIILDLLAQQISSTVPYGPIAPAPPPPPPTPLPDIEVVYSAPSQFNLFASDVSLVTETPLGWNFTKTINDANKMELYLYHSSAPGAVPFTYSQMRDIKVNMKNNLVLPAGEIFVTIWTGPPTAPNWYNYKDIYNFTPPLGTTIDVSLVEHILNLTDTRTDPILAIAIHSNSAQQQVNCDVERVSFEILLPATNNSQRVIVKLQNNFVAVDNHYWDLDDAATARLGTTIIPAFDIHSFSPNIVAGNYPQNVTAKEGTAGCALYVSGTWQLWETADGTTWTATPNATITLIAQTSVSPIPPGPSSNGFAYIGTKGAFDNFGTGLPLSNRPITWDVTTSNQLEMTWTGSSTALFAPLVDMTTPNNFTTAQIASGFFDTNATAGGTAVRVFISSATSPSGDPVASRDIDIVVKSETEISIKRSWELSVTTYTINVNDPKQIIGQYTDPVYTTSVAPDSFSMPTNWLETADNVEHFEILFSGGLNNSLPAESQNFRQMTVTPTPSNTQLTFTWVANYYTAGNILISPVLGIGTSGLVSGFTTGGSLKPANAAYILYGCTSSDNVDAFTSLVFIEPTAAESFNLTFSGGLNNQISADGTYSVAPSPVDATSTYAYTAVFRDISGTSLGAVPNAGASGTSSAFTIAYASLPANVAYIDYNATATGGGQDGEVAQLSITIIPAVVPCPPCDPCDSCCPAIPGNDDVELIRATTGNIEFDQINADESLKLLSTKNLGELKMSLVDSYGSLLHTDKPVYYECQLEAVNSGGSVITDS